MSFNEQEKIELISDIKVIKRVVEEDHPQVRANTRFRFMAIGFVTITMGVLTICKYIGVI